MNRILFVLALFLVTDAYAQQPNPARQERQPLTRAEPERAAKAQELLAQTRAALSQKAKLNDLKTLSVNGKIRRLIFTAARGHSGQVVMMGLGADLDPTVLGATEQREQFVNGKVEYEFSLPDKFRWEDESLPFQKSGFFDGDHFWQKPPPNQPVMPPQVLKAMQQRTQAAHAYLSLGLLLTPPPGFALEYSYTDEKPFQQTIADVIAITGPGTFKADLYLDQKTHWPLLLRFVTSAPSRPAMAFMPHGTSRTNALATTERARDQAEAKPPGQQERIKLILFTDYRAVDGILFPHKISTQINGKLIEELVFTKFKLNQPIKPEKFSEKQ